MMRAVALELGLVETFEAWPCPCGNRSLLDAPCGCTVRQVERHLRKLPTADITVEMVRPLERETKTPGTSLADMRKQIEAKADYQKLDLDKISANLLRAASKELGLDPDVQQRIILVARTIANLDGRRTIESSHLCEAINYRMMR